MAILQLTPAPPGWRCLYVVTHDAGTDYSALSTEQLITEDPIACFALVDDLEPRVEPIVSAGDYLELASDSGGLLAVVGPSDETERWRGDALAYLTRVVKGAPA